MADPALGRRLRGGAGAARQELETVSIDRLLADYRQRLSGGTPPVLHRMRELWNYLSEQLRRTRSGT